MLFPVLMDGAAPGRNEINPTEQRKSDAELIRMARQDNPEAFAALFNAHKSKVYSICLRMTGDTAEAEDLTQEGFL